MSGERCVWELVHRLLFALHKIDEPEEVVAWFESDSSSALQLVQSISKTASSCRDSFALVERTNA